ncbi:MAG: response regulator [Terriglobia bacterium]
MERLRILLADDHPVVLKGLHALLDDQPGWEVCGEAEDGQQAVAEVSRLKPDIVVLDLTMPKLNGLEAARRILQMEARTAVLILSAHDSEEMVREALGIGVHGYVLKSDAGEELVMAIQAVRRRKRFVSSRLRPGQIDLAGRTSATQQPVDAGGDGSVPSLSPREREVVQLLAEGETTKEVATRLRITVKTAETHRSNIMRKLGIHSASEMVRYAIRNNIVQP